MQNTRGPFNNYVWTRGAGRWSKKCVFVHAQGIKTVTQGGWSKMAKLCPSSCWMTPSATIDAFLFSEYSQSFIMVLESERKRAAHWSQSPLTVKFEFLSRLIILRKSPLVIVLSKNLKTRYFTQNYYPWDRKTFSWNWYRYFERQKLTLTIILKNLIVKFSKNYPDTCA